MKTVAFYSNTSESENIAKYLAGKIGCEIVDITKTERYDFDELIFVFPVYCQNIPKRAEEFLGKIRCNSIIPIATYGKMSYGNVLNDLQQKFPHKIISAAYVPTKHTYLDEKRFDDFDKLDILTEKSSADDAIMIPKTKKSFWADLLTEQRSRLGVKLIRTERCNNCGICTENCPEKAINNGITDNNCIRCLRCVENCPEKALEYKLIYPMRKYLSKVKCDEIKIYV